MKVPDNIQSSNEDGYALLTSFMATLVVLTLSLIAVNLSLHNTEASGMDRDRVRAVHAAEAGINDAMSRILGTGAAGTAPCLVTASTTATPAASYEATVTYYAAWPLDGAPVIECVGNALPGGVAPRGAVIDSTGTAGRVSRRMETATRLTPVFGGVLDKAIFADGTLGIGNKVVIEGDVYTNEDWTCPNNIEIRGSFFGQGFAHMSNTCRVLADLHVNGDLTMQNQARIDGSAMSALWPVSLANDSSIGGDVFAKDACTGCVAPRIDLARLTISTSAGPAPPTESLPEIYFVAADWDAAGYTIVPFAGATACTEARDHVVSLGAASPPTVVRITESCDLTFENKTSVVLHHDLAIITDGSIEFLNNGVWTTPDARTRDLFLIVPYGTSCTSPPDNGHIVKSNNTDFDHLHFLVYSPCRVVFSNNNTTSSGQIYGTDVNVENNFELAFQPMFVPGLGETTTVVGFDSQVAYIREINR